MIGISKEDLEALIYADAYGYDFIDPDEAIAACKELNPRRIVLEETDEIRFVKHGEYYEASGQVYRFTKDEESSHKFKVWREVKE
jgi:hypothetical protein